MTHTRLPVYAALSRRGRPKSYIGKIMLVAFLGTHVPLLALLCYFIIATSLSLETAGRVLVVALFATLGGTAITLYALHKLLAPVKLVCQGLRGYLDEKLVPELPTEYTDEVGVLMSDTSFTIRKIDDAIRFMSSYDELTTLPNRTLFCERLRQALAQTSRTRQSIAVFLLDLDGFKNINNRRGNETGDRLLKAVAQRLSGCIRETDVLARLGADQFVLFHSDFCSPDDVSALAARTLEAIARPYRIDGQELHTSASLGITLAPSDADGVEGLLRNAETAMFHAKQSGHGSFQFYSADLNARLQHRLELESEMHGALERGEFMLYYQPQIEVGARRIVGVEALLRWNNPQRGLVLPADFIPVAEECGLIVPIGEWVLQTACAQSRAWQRAGLPPMRVAVNLSARQFRDENLLSMVSRTLAATELDPALLELEITESLVMENVDDAIGMMRRLNEMGITLSLDDFGTGYSSLSYLKCFPLHTLKIDQSFVRDLHTDSGTAVIADAIIALGHSLHLEIVAEGIETEEQFNYLKARGCNIAQGYLFSRPVPADDLVQLLAEDVNLVSAMLEESASETEAAPSFGL